MRSLKVILLGLVMAQALYGCGSSSSSSSAGGGIIVTPDTPDISVAMGLLDMPAFNGVGYNTFNVANSHDNANGVAIAADGSIFMAGYARGANYDMAVWKVQDSGLLDSSFGASGVVLLDSPAGGNGHDFLDDLAIDGDGKIVVAGHSRNAAGNDDLVVARFNSDGTLDDTFGGDVNPVDGTPDGFTVIDVSGSGSAESSGGIALDDIGNIYVTGFSDAAGSNDILVWRFTSTGTLDTTFAAGAGYLSYDSASGTSDDRARDIAIDSNGNILVSGVLSINIADSTPESTGSKVLLRVTSTGDLDNSFNGSGVITGNGTAGNGVTTDSSGNIVVVGYKSVPGNYLDATVWRYKNDGSVDTTFGGDYDGDLIADGYVTHDGAGIDKSGHHDYAEAVAIDAAGNIVVGGSAFSNINGLVRTDMVVWRFTNAGVLDTTFGDDVDPADGDPDGYITLANAAGANSYDKCFGVALDAQGRVVAVGYSSSPTNGSDAAILRLK